MTVAWEKLGPSTLYKTHIMKKYKYIECIHIPMTAPVHRDCGTVVEELYMIYNYEERDIRYVAYYCPLCKVILTNDENMRIQSLNDEEVRLDYVNLTTVENLRPLLDRKKHLNKLNNGSVG